MANNHGGARHNSGRKSKSKEEELISLLDEAWPKESRLRVIRVLAAKAEASDVRAISLMLSYAYGTPPSGDELKLQEAIDAEFDKLTETLKKSLTAEAWREVAAVFGLDG